MDTVDVGSIENGFIDIFLGYGKPASNIVVIMTRAHLSQPKFELYTFGMSIVGIQHIDRWGAAPPISVYEIRVFEHCFYVIRSIVMLLLPVLLVRFGSLGKSLISFLALRIFKFYV